mmetsp:Transcript_13329/g.9409  ORF Transcript_13329/g.9409 Transcript_13329/m.9409 type:complete len:107 (-) Transcript_13329:430-750(-)
MIAQTEHISAKNKNAYVNTIKGVYSKEGAIGFYRGWIPPFFGSIIFRSAQFAVFEAAFTKMNDYPWAKEHIPMSGGLEWRVLIAGLMGGSMRSIIECPFEYAKVKR